VSTVIEREPQATAQDEMPPFPVRRWTLEEYQRLIELDVFEEERLELLQGWIIPKYKKSPLWASTCGIIASVLRAKLEGTVPTQLRHRPLFTFGDNMPEADLAIVRGDLGDFDTRHPEGRELLLVIEVTDGTIIRDRWKVRLYAGARIPAYWIVNLEENQIESYDHLDVERGNYTRQQIHRSGDVVPLTLGQTEVTIGADEILPRSRRRHKASRP
jgi:Uma2 family endonuclease